MLQGFGRSVGVDQVYAGLGKAGLSQKLWIVAFRKHSHELKIQPTGHHRSHSTRKNPKQLDLEIDQCSIMEHKRQLLDTRFTSC